jgi:hypothetical protein
VLSASAGEFTALLDEAEFRARSVAPGDRVGLVWAEADARPLAAGE